MTRTLERFFQKYVFVHSITLTMLVISFTLSSCELINPDEPIPVYLECDTISFHATTPEQGSSSSAISDAWVFVDGVLQGIYEMPAHFPVLAEGSHKITVKPGIVINGIKNARGAYPFYASFDTTLNLEPTKTYTLHPRSTYLSVTQFKLMEDFEQSGLVLERAPNSDTTLNIQLDAEAFEGHYGAVYLDAARPYFNYRSLHSFYVSPGTTVFAELNYRCDNEFSVGILSQVGSDLVAAEAITIRPTTTWKKIYVSLSDAISSQPSASSYKFYITATKSSTLLNATILLDNVKVLR